MSTPSETERLRAGLVALRDVLPRLRSFIEYARYELDDGPLVVGHQFPTKDCADKELARIDEALANASRVLGDE